jgi:hypothetical protein
MIRAYLDEGPGTLADRLYVEHGNGELTTVEDMRPGHWPVFSLPTTAVELIAPDDAAEWAWRQISAVKMTKPARVAVLAALGLDENGERE